jgi:hypothetical protein
MHGGIQLGGGRSGSIEQARQAAAGQGDGGKGYKGEGGDAHGDLPDEMLT